ncbi:NAD(P)-binding domain-containing protein [Calidifontibacillus erzurumensis]|uniref:NAD(P)-binding domain-containing protein n=1 Tax=Calidifontibacillus erzurumensis TaxID=2741433 RepID=A0A8J8GFQ3_9BACI|nr:NAD(P)-binding domain-containing protein [Calidifontibacillus erzurumensis]NSL53100.1 NAD(P)-binding domain-containing protein [Calidifontibacillus erzurumensis]
MKSIALVGIGRLGKALVKQWDNVNQKIGIYHPSNEKVNLFITNFSNGIPVSADKLPKMETIILALPAEKVKEFLKLHHYTNSTYVNMATSVQTTVLQKEFPNLQIVSMKFVGHAQDLYLNGNGYFITEQGVPDNIISLFSKIGEVRKGNPDVVYEINKLATYYGIKAAVELEKELKSKNFDPVVIERALISIAPEVMKAYLKGDLGHFARSVAEQMQKQE